MLPGYVVSTSEGQPIDEIGLVLTSRLGGNPSQSDVLPELNHQDLFIPPTRVATHGKRVVSSSEKTGVLPQDSVLLFGSVVELARSQNHHLDGTKEQKGGTSLSL